MGKKKGEPKQLRNNKKNSLKKEISEINRKLFSLGAGKTPLPSENTENSPIIEPDMDIEIWDEPNLKKYEPLTKTAVKENSENVPKKVKPFKKSNNNKKITASPKIKKDTIIISKPLVKKKLAKKINQKVSERIKQSPKSKEKTGKHKIKEKIVSAEPTKEKKSKIENLNIKTHFDTLIELLSKRKRIPLSEVLTFFKIDTKTAHEWGKLLSENNILDFHVPAFGEPEFREKGIVIKQEKTKKKLDKKKLLALLGIALGILILVIGIILFSGKPEETIEEIPEEAQEEIVEEPVVLVDSVKLAFSGNGTYDCRSEDGNTKYAIKNTWLKIEELDGSSKAIIKNNLTYTLNIETGAWITSAIREDVAVPGSGIYPKTTLDCQSAEIEEQEFDT